jgi:hypothetical protein
MQEGWYCEILAPIPIERREHVGIRQRNPKRQRLIQSAWPSNGAKSGAAPHYNQDGEPTSILVHRRETTMPKFRAVQVDGKDGPFGLVERELPQPGPGEVRVKVQACSVCHSDSIAKEGLLPSVPYPIVPKHEIAGVIDAVGSGVVGWSIGTRVGVGRFGGHCGRCESCRRGCLVDCRNLRIPGITYDGGYADAMVAPADALALIPDDLSPTEAAPLLCAGVTTFHALRESGARPGDLVAIFGIGGLAIWACSSPRRWDFAQSHRAWPRQGSAGTAARRPSLCG